MHKRFIFLPSDFFCSNLNSAVAPSAQLGCLSLSLIAMAPKKKAAKSVGQTAAATSGCFDIELAQGERDSANLSYIEKLHDAVACIIDHPIFSGIVAADPMHITSDNANSSSQAAFDSRSFTNAMKSSHKSYTAGINAFWIDMLWSATPGVPVRMSGIHQMASTTFKVPTKLPPVHIAVQSVDSNVLKIERAHV